MTQQPDVTGETILEARFDPMVKKYLCSVIVFISIVTVVGIPFLPFILIFCWWYCPEFFNRMSARLTDSAILVKQGVFFRKEATIPLNRVTDVRLHDDPLMRWCGVRGLKVETAGSSGQNAGSEGDLVGIVDAVAFRDAILRQRRMAVEGAAQSVAVSAIPTTSSVTPLVTNELLAEIRDILSRIEESRGG